MVFLEALSVGCPTIAKTSNVVSHLVSKYDVGEVYSKGTELIEALNRVGENSAEMKMRSLELYRTEFTEHAWISRMNEIYQRAIS